MNDPVEILVTGATGNQGNAVCRSFLAQGHRVRALVHRPETLAAQTLESLGAELVKGDADDAEALEYAIRGADAVFAVGAPAAPGGADGEVRQMLNVANAVRRSGVAHLIYSSVAGCDRHTGIPFFESKARIEDAIREARIPFTIVRPVFFMENILSSRSLPMLRMGVLRLPLSPRRRLQQISLEDLGAFTRHVARNRERFQGLTIEIASDEISGEESAAVLSRVCGRGIVYEQTPLDEARSMMGDDYARMFEWFNNVGHRVNIPDLRRFYPEVQWHSYEQWAKEQSWEDLLGMEAA